MAEKNEFGDDIIDEEVNEFGDKIITIPGRGEERISAAPEPKKFFRTMPSGRRVEREPTRGERLEEFGISSEVEGGSIESRLAASLGTEQDIRNQLSNQFKVSPDSLDIAQFRGIGWIFLNPRTGKYEPLDPARIEGEDWVQFAVEAPVIAADIIGSIDGFRRGGVPGAVIEGGLAAGGVKAIQLEALKAAGIITPSQFEIAGKALKEGAIAAGFNFIPTLGRLLKGGLQPSLRGANVLAREGVTSEKLIAGKEALQPVEEATGAQFSAGQRLEAAADLQTGTKFAEDKAVAAKVLGTEQTEREATGTAERQFSQSLQEKEFKQKLVEESSDPQAVGKEISAKAQEQYLSRVDDVHAVTNAEIDRINLDLAKIAGKGGATAGASIRNIVETGREKVFDTISKQYDAIWAQIPKGTRVSVEGINRVGKKWLKKLRGDFFPSLAAEDKKLVLDALRPSPTKTVKLTSPAGGTIEATVDVGRKISAANRGITILKEKVRDIGKPLGGPQVREKKLMLELIDELQAARTAALDSIDPVLAKQLKETDALWRTANEELDDGVVGAIMTRKKGSKNFRVADDNVFREITRTEEGLKEYLRIAKKHPELNAVDDMKQVMDGKYTAEVIEGTKKHSTWMAQNESQLKLLYSPEEMKRFTNAGKLKEDIVRLEKKRAEDLRELKGFENKDTGFVYKLSYYDPEQAVRAVKGSPTNAERMLKIVGKDRLGDYRKVRVTQLMEDTAGDPGAIRKALTGDSGRELEITLGKDYIKDLETLLTLGEAISTKGAGTLMRHTKGDSGGLIDFAKGIFFGPLNKKGYRVNLAKRFFPGATDGAILDMLRDPDKLAAILKTNEMRIDRKGYWNIIIGTLGFTANDISNMVDFEEGASREELARFMGETNLIQRAEPPVTEEISEIPFSAFEGEIPNFLNNGNIPR